jgi:PAS domain S-box-containing protein
MKNEDKTREQLIYELENACQRINELENSEIEHELTENALRKSEEKFRLFYENLPIPYQSLDSSGCFIEVNNAFLDTLGYTKDEVIGRSFESLMTPECACTFEKRFFHFMECGYLQKAEYELIRKDNNSITIIVDGNVEYDLDGTFKQTHCVWSDITDRKLWEESLIESEDRHRFLYEYNPSMYFTVNAEGTVLSVNQFGAGQLGYAVHELVGQSVLKVFHQKDKEAAIRNMERCVENLGHLFHWELRKIRKDGTMLWVKETARAVKGTDGKITVLIVCEDITELKELENALREAHDNLELKVQERTIELSKCNIRLESDIGEIKRIERVQIY